MTSLLAFQWVSQWASRIFCGIDILGVIVGGIFGGILVVVFGGIRVTD